MMDLLWILLTTLSLSHLVKSELLTPQTNSSVTTVTLLEKYGYPVETHEVTTEDGYILVIHRIPNPGSAIAFIVTGLSASSSDAVILGDNSLGEILFNAGFDVWIGNSRGNDYSNRNINFSNQSPQFWNFSFNEIGVYDFPAMINYISDNTGIQQVRFFGHSQGTTAYLVLTSLMPEWNDRFIAAHLLAPVAFMSHLTNKFINLISPVAGQPNALKELIGSMKLKPSKETLLVLSTLLCPPSRPDRILCENSLFLTTGFNEDTVDNDFIPDIMATTPSSASTNQYLHYVQEFNSGYFRKYDYGPRNLLEYGSLTPPSYDLNNVKGPIFMYFGEADEFVARTDLDILIEKLPNSTVAGVYVVPVANFDHLAFLYTKNIREKVYNKVMEDVASTQ
ncbi:lipase 3-like [Episyrphus balteatus]|uniref:lipase 3-like n=1 Tax=Episyrphus balteatus TaxID=286459 RepID=UPI0024855E61|nr:lipase 3-like [Episyrphus balteatus]